MNSQVVCDLRRGVLKSKANRIARVAVKFNVPRNCRTFETMRFFFVELGLYPGERIAVPIRKNRSFQRLRFLLHSGWNCKTYGLTPTLEIAAYLSKDEKELVPRGNMLGIDLNAKNLSYTVLSPTGDILKQGYLGQHIWHRKRRFEERRSMLKSFRALKKLKQMRHRQRDFVYTNLGQTVKEIMLLARKFGADVAIERISRFKAKGRAFNRKVMTIPFHIFRRILEARCFDNSIKLNMVDPYHTSKWCSRCGAVGKGHDGGNYAMFRCRNCGLALNSDRKASLAVAVKSLLERNRSINRESFQISGRRVPVSGLMRPSPMTQGRTAVLPSTLARGKPTGYCG